MAQQPAERSAHGDVSLARALALVRDLRARCPWDHAQTRDTLRGMNSVTLFGPDDAEATQHGLSRAKVRPAIDAQGVRPRPQHLKKRLSHFDRDRAFKELR